MIQLNTGVTFIEKIICEDLKTQAMEIINFEKKERKPLTHDEQVYYEKRKYCHICRKKFCDDKDDKKI